MMTAPVAMTTMSVATVATPATVAVVATMLTPTAAQAGRKDGVTDPHYDDFFGPAPSGLVLSECYDGLVLSECFDNID